VFYTLICLEHAQKIMIFAFQLETRQDVRVDSRHVFVISRFSTGTEGVFNQGEGAGSA